MRYLSPVLTAAVLTVFLLITGCTKDNPAEPTNHAPQILSLTCSADTIHAGQVVTFRVNARDADGDSLQYAWSASDGALLGNIDQSEVRWEAPDGDATAHVDVTVSDGSLEAQDRYDIALQTVATWSRTYGEGTGEMGRSLVLTPDNRLAALSTGYFTGDPSSAFILRFLDLNGTVLQEQTYTVGDNYNEAFQISYEPGDGFLMVGHAYINDEIDGDIAAIRVRADGGMVWEEHYGGPAYEDGQGVAIASDGGAYLLGNSESFDTAGGNAGLAWVVKIAADGTEEWNVPLSQYCESSGASSGIAEMPGGGCIVGYSRWNDSAHEAFATGIGDHGELLWSSSLEDGWVVHLLEDRGIYVALTAHLDVAESAYRYALVGLDGNGVVLWRQELDLPGHAGMSMVAPTDDDGFILVGSIYSDNPSDAHDALLAKVAETGETEWTRTWDRGSLDTLSDVTQAPDGGYYCFGMTRNADTDRHSSWLIKTDALGNTAE